MTEIAKDSSGAQDGGGSELGVNDQKGGVDSSTADDSDLPCVTCKDTSFTDFPDVDAVVIDPVDLDAVEDSADAADLPALVSCTATSPPEEISLGACDDGNPLTLDICIDNKYCVNKCIAHGCLTNSDCNDNDLCTYDTCAYTATQCGCKHAPIPGCKYK
jgi:hypothetical protein